MRELTDAEKVIVLGDLFSLYEGSYIWNPARHINWNPEFGVQMPDGSWITQDEATGAFAELNV